MCSFALSSLYSLRMRKGGDVDLQRKLNIFGTQACYYHRALLVEKTAHVFGDTADKAEDGLQRVLTQDEC